LRHLILAPEQTRIEQLRERLDDPEQHAGEVSRILPRAVDLCSRQGEGLAGALTPTVTEIIKVAVKKDIRTFADALFPVIGPAIRKSIAETFKQMIQSLNQTLELGFSWRGLKWRIESWRSGKPFAEVVLLHSLVYRVEQLFLVHRESGVLLQHLSSEGVEFQDADLVSGMLTAIRDFVQDSFDTEEEQALDTIEVGDLGLWIEQGPTAIIAAAVRGNAPRELRTQLREALEQVHLEKGAELEAFEGDPAPFEVLRPQLEFCLQTRYQERKRRWSPFLLLLPLALLLGLGTWGYYSIREQQRLDAYLQQLETAPGIVVTGVERRGGAYHLTGLRDPLADDPALLLESSEMEADQVIHHLAPYQALDPELLPRRAEKILEPPATIELSFEPGLDEGATITARGIASYNWLQQAQMLVRLLPGATRLDTEGVEIDVDLTALDPPQGVTLELQEGVVIAAGTAPREWIAWARNKAIQIPGVVGYDDSGLNNEALEALARLKAELEQEVILFSMDAAYRDQPQGNGQKRIRDKITRLSRLADKAGKMVTIEIVGHTDSAGRHAHNLALSRMRAEHIRGSLVANGVSPSLVTAVGVGASEPVREETTEQDRAMNRSVTFKVHIQGHGNANLETQ